jgi:hypothetical protein
MTDARCARQRLLPEVGHAGQEKLARTPAEVVDEPGADVAWEYLRRAGVQHHQVVEGSAQPFPHAAHLRYTAPLTVAKGAWTALRHVRYVLSLA